MRKFLFAVLGVILPGLLAYYARYIEPKWIAVTKKTVILSRLDKAFDGYKIAQLSDIHFDDLVDTTQLHRAVKLINKQKPDLIVITGDFASRNMIYSMDGLIVALSKLQAKDGVMAIPGNHDYWNPQNIDRIRQMLRDLNITELSNTHRTVHRKGAQLHIAGVDDVVALRSRLDLVLADLPPTGSAILLAHEPDFADISSPTRRFDLQISGHTHGGQIRLPLIGPLVSTTHGHRYNAGIVDVDGMLLYVNRGLGTVTLPMRFNCRPEITLFKLKAPDYRTHIKA